uniref:Uncharacterized protein n=1 Tax=Rhizophora mucronata TaxID=61149 RepID=A0A2P2PT59_RHIMU
MKPVAPTMRTRLSPVAACGTGVEMVILASRRRRTREKSKAT